MKKEIEDVESFESNYNRYKVGTERHDLDEALSCITYLVNKINHNDVLKLYKVEVLALKGMTEEALTLLKSVSAAGSNPDIFYLKGLIELYSGDSAKAKNFFT